MIKAGTRVRIVYLGKNDAKYFKRKEYYERTGRVLFPGLFQWTNNKFHYGNLILDNPTPGLLEECFHQIRVKVLEVPDEA